MSKTKNTHITYITHTKKQIIFLIKFFLYIEMTNNFYQKTQRKV